MTSAAAPAAAWQLPLEPADGVPPVAICSRWQFPTVGLGSTLPADGRSRTWRGWQSHIGKGRTDADDSRPTAAAV